MPMRFPSAWAATGTDRRVAPLALLLASLAALFPLLYEAGPLHRTPHHYDHITFNHLNVAKNLSAEHGWLGFYARTLDADGKAIYYVYNRFPPLGYGLIKLAASSQAGNPWGEVQAARMLMLACFAAAAVLAYFSLARLVGRRWLVLAATLAAFGSYAALRACDMVATEGSMDLFAVMLAFHGIACYCGPRGPGLAPDAAPRFGQLLAKVCAALLLGWHVYALLAPFLGLGLAAALAGRNRAECRRLLLLGALAFLFGLAVLLQNFVREYAALHGETAVWDLPSFQSMRRRLVLLGIADGLWLEFFQEQLHRIGLALAPYAATRQGIAWPGWQLAGALGLAAIAGAATAVARTRRGPRGVALAALASTGPVWAIGMRGTFFSYKDSSAPPRDVSDIFEAMFHVGVPLALFALLAMWAGRFRRERPAGSCRAAAAVLAVAAGLAFAASAFHMGRLNRDVEVARYQRLLLADVEPIRRLAAGKRLLTHHFFHLGRWYGGSVVKGFHLANNTLILGPAHARFAELALAPMIPGARTLTPDNRLYFLYDMAEYRRHCAAPRLCPAVPGWGRTLEDVGPRRRG